MSISKQLVERFQAIYKIKFGNVIGFSEAEMQLKNLEDLIRLTASETKESQDA
jgi:hypothetical protein